jgi:hypothetical protein
MKFLGMKDKMHQLFKIGDNSIYLHRLILRAYNLEPVYILAWIKNVCRELGVSKQQESRYIWVIAKSKNRLMKYKDWLAIGQRLY